MPIHLHHLKRGLAAIVAALAMAFPAAAVAQQSGQDAYKPQGQIEEDVGGDTGGVGGSPGAGGGVAGENANSAPSGNAGGGLPFTGMDVALLAGAGALLLGAGVGMRRVAHRQDLA
jgi:hypothetical protein